MYKLKIIFYLVCISVTTVYAQVENKTFNSNYNNSSIFKNVKSDIVTFYDVGVNLFQSPFKFDNSDLFLTGTLLSITAAAMPFDDRIRMGALKNQNKTFDKISFATEKFGDPIYGTILSGVLYGSGLIIGDDYTRQTGQMLAEAMLFNGLISTGAKMMFNRSRPFTNEGSYELEFFEFESDFEETSLPSGHTSTAFTVATVLSQRIDNIYASIALYSMASLTALQRVYVDKHWFSDTILGAALGTVVGLKVVKLHEENSSPQSGFQYSIYPRVNSGNYGIGFALQF
jgi:PAP2 superfamily protein